MNRLLSALAIAPRTAVWPAVLAALLGIGLMTAFHQVVQGAVDRSTLRRQIPALYAEADRRCRVVPALVRRAMPPAAVPIASAQSACRQAP